LSLPKQVMVVEDEAITQRYLVNILEASGVDFIKCFDSADDVLREIKEKTYDMILMDINIKGSIDGIRLAKHILKEYCLPIVFISAYSDEETLDEVLELAPYGFVTKPFSSNEVLASIKIAYKRFLTFEGQKKEDEKDHMVMITEHYLYSLENSALYVDGKMADLNASSVDEAMKIIEGTARSMGIHVS